jgi:hypothetical protein
MLGAAFVVVAGVLTLVGTVAAGAFKEDSFFTASLKAADALALFAACICFRFSSEVGLVTLADCFCAKETEKEKLRMRVVRHAFSRKTLKSFKVVVLCIIKDLVWLITDNTNAEEFGQCLYLTIVRNLKIAFLT